MIGEGLFSDVLLLIVVFAVAMIAFIRALFYWKRGKGPGTHAGSVCSVGLCDRVILVVDCRHDFIKTDYSDLVICRKTGRWDSSR